MVEKWQTKHAVNYNKEEQHDFARQLADESIVLLQNKHHLLPLNDTQSIAVIGELVAKPRFQGGGSSHVTAHRLVTPLEAMPASATYAQGYQLEHDGPLLGTIPKPISGKRIMVNTPSWWGVSQLISASPRALN